MQQVGWIETVYIRKNDIFRFIDGSLDRHKFLINDAVQKHMKQVSGPWRAFSRSFST